LLPFVIAAKAGDRGAERELLLRLTPVALEVARSAFGPNDPDGPKLALETLVATLKALPTFRGDEAIAPAVAQIALQRARVSGRSLLASESAILAAARLRFERGARAGDGNRVVSLVERALEDDAAVLLSHIGVRKSASGDGRLYLVALLIGLLLAGALGWLWVSHVGRSSEGSVGPAATALTAQC
jgi:hypothetical protein